MMLYREKNGGEKGFLSFLLQRKPLLPLYLWFDYSRVICQAGSHGLLEGARVLIWQGLPYPASGPQSGEIIFSRMPVRL